MGLIGGILVICTIGFIVLLIGTLGDDDNRAANNNQPSLAVNTGGTNPTPSAPSAAVSVKPVTDDDKIRGDVNAPITVIEYSDLDCPFCGRFHETMVQVLDQYDGDVRWVYRHFPLTSLHPEAAKKAEGAECANELGGNDAFWQYTDKLFENSVSLSQLGSVAEQIGLNRSSFEDCLNSGKYAGLVAQQGNDAVAAGGTGTPYSIIVDADGNTTPINGAVPISRIQTVVDAAL